MILEKSLTVRIEHMRNPSPWRQLYIKGFEQRSSLRTVLMRRVVTTVCFIDMSELQPG